MSEPISPGRHISRLIPGDVLAASLKAEEIISEARLEAEKILVSAREEAEEIRSEARRAGREEGLASAAEWIHRAHRYHEDILKEAEPDIVRLAVEIAQKIIHAEVTSSQETIRKIVVSVLNRARRMKNVVVSVHPDDLQVCEAATDEWKAAGWEAANITFVADAQISRGGCLVKTPAGILDARLETQLAILRRVLEDLAKGTEDAEEKGV